MYQKIAKIVRKIRHIGLGRAIQVMRYRLANKSRRRRVSLKGGADGSREVVSYSYRPLAWVLVKKHTSLYIGGQIADSYPWHEEYEDVAQTFFKDIVIRTGQGSELAPDIKTPWEYSRFLWGVELAQTYRQTGQVAYQKRYIELINDWIEHNPPLRGINWLCPMEVALRAINWIISFTILYEQLDEQTRQRSLESLYDHMIYLERNWELADGRTSNHYLSDLVGYLYLVWFFNLSQKQTWVIAQLENEMAWQVFDEGTSYEGSTAYHQLVTELFVHADLMARECGISFSPQFYAKLSLMKQFIADCSYAENQLVKIGDDDSGRVTDFKVINLPVREVSYSKYYPQFGLSIIKTSHWHATLRHPAYHARQPSGHFHDDAGSVTLAYQGIPILVDPGSYVYTPSAWWRNYFRSAAVHNKLYEKSHAQDYRYSDMFTLTLPELVDRGNCFESDEKLAMNTSYWLGSCPQGIAHRNVEWDALTNSIIISDDLVHDDLSNLYANLTFAPQISVQRMGAHWMVIHEDKPLLMMQSDLDYQPYDAWVAPRYGEKIKTVGLRAVAVRRKTITNFLLLPGQEDA